MNEARSRPRALIVEDEIVIALDLEIAMSDLGYEVCALAPSERSARAVAMQEQPDLAVVDVCLAGGREGIEMARWLREVCGTSIVFVTACTTPRPWIAFGSVCRERRFWRSRFIATGLADAVARAADAALRATRAPLYPRGRSPRRGSLGRAIALLERRVEGLKRNGHPLEGGCP